MLKLENNLLDGEKIISITHIHYFILFVPGLVLVVACLPFVVLSMSLFFKYIFPIFFVICLALELKYFLIFKTTEYVLTNKRLIKNSGILQHDFSAILLNQIESIKIDQNIFDRVVGSGTILAKGTGSSLVEFYNISSPLVFYNSVQNQMQLAKSALADNV